MCSNCPNPFRNPYFRNNPPFLTAFKEGIVVEVPSLSRFGRGLVESGPSRWSIVNTPDQRIGQWKQWHRTGANVEGD